MFKEIKLENSRQVGDGAKGATLFSVVGACGGGGGISTSAGPSSGGGGGGGSSSNCIWAGCTRPAGSGWFSPPNAIFCNTIACSVFGR